MTPVIFNKYANMISVTVIKERITHFEPINYNGVGTRIHLDNGSCIEVRQDRSEVLEMIFDRQKNEDKNKN